MFKNSNKNSSIFIFKQKIKHFSFLITKAVGQSTDIKKYIHQKRNGGVAP